tara:strand:- start:173 stop:364 length:192 start_codon:yes stop_codon:yes gene_type:complete
MKKKHKIAWGLGLIAGLTATSWGTWEQMKALRLQKNIDSIPYEIENEKDRRAGWFTKYRGQWF